MADQSSEEAARLHKFVDPVGYLSAFVSNGVRPDGRSCSTARNVTLNIGSISTANGSAMVKLGQTCVLAAVKMELSNPPLECPSRGYLVCNIDQSSSSLSEALSGPPTSEAQSLSQTLQDLLSRFVDCDDLILVESKLCWTVYVDVVCLCNSGNVWDACVLASTVALINTQVPAVNTDVELPLVSISSRRSLKLGTVPLAATFTIFKDKYCLLDPSREEELICDGTVSVIYFEDGGIAQITHAGKPLSSERLISICKDGQTHTQTLYKLLNTVCT